MDEHDYYWLSACILILALAGLITAGRLRRVDTDVQFLMDHAVTRETIGGRTDG